MKNAAQLEMVGLHWAKLEQPDTIFVEINGDISAEDIRGLLVHVARLGDGEGPVYFVQDLSKLGSFRAAARTEIAKDPRTARVAVVVCIGASFHVRVIMSMIDRALKFVRPTTPLILFATDMAEARALVAAEKQKRTTA